MPLLLMGAAVVPRLLPWLVLLPPQAQAVTMRSALVGVAVVADLGFVANT